MAGYLFLISWSALVFCKLNDFKSGFYFLSLLFIIIYCYVPYLSFLYIQIYFFLSTFLEDLLCRNILCVFFFFGTSWNFFACVLVSGSKSLHSKILVSITLSFCHSVNNLADRFFYRLVWKIKPQSIYQMDRKIEIHRSGFWNLRYVGQRPHFGRVFGERTCMFKGLTAKVFYSKCMKLCT